MTGIEPATGGLLDHCSTNWATRPEHYVALANLSRLKKLTVLRKSKNIYAYRKKKPKNTYGLDRIRTCNLTH